MNLTDYSSGCFRADLQQNVCFIGPSPPQSICPAVDPRLLRSCQQQTPQPQPIHLFFISFHFFFISPYIKAIFHGVHSTALLAMSRFKFKVYFSGRDDPRDACIVIGEDTKPVFFEFETAVVAPCLTRTTVRARRPPSFSPSHRDRSRATDTPSPRLTGTRTAAVSARSPSGTESAPWNTSSSPGPPQSTRSLLAPRTLGCPADPMPRSARRFQAADGRFYEWRRRQRDALESYEVRGLLFLGL